MTEATAYIMLLIILGAIAVGCFWLTKCIFGPGKTHDEGTVLDHVEVMMDNSHAAKELRKQAMAAKRAEAKNRHGREFHTDDIKKRETELSRALLEFNEASAQTVKRGQLDRISKVRVVR